MLHRVLELFIQQAVMEKLFPYQDRKQLYGLINEVAAEMDLAKSIPDALDILSGWQDDTARMAQVLSAEVLSVEQFSKIDIKTKHGARELMFAIDRLDRVEPGYYRVVDYKSTFYPLDVDDVYRSIQGRVYAVMVCMTYPDVRIVDVQMDYLRSNPVVVTFTRDECKGFFLEIRRLMERIIESDGTKETINDQCRFCLRSVSCETLLKFKSVGAPVGKTADELAELAYIAESVASGWGTIGKYSLEQLEIIMRAEETDYLDCGDYEIVRKQQSRRSVDKEQIFKMVPHLKARFGDLSPVKALDACVKETVDPMAREMLKMLATSNKYWKTVARRKLGT